VKVSELVDQLASGAMPLTVALNKTLIICRRNGLDQAAAWIDKELRGYSRDENVPNHRLVRGMPQAFNPHRGWQPILHQGDGPLPVQMTTGAIGQPISQIEEMVSNDPTGELEYQWGPETEAKIQSSLVDFKTNVRMIFSASQLGAICTHIKSELIDFLLKIEKVVPSEATKTHEKSLSAAMEQAERTLIVNNFGSIGNFSNASRDFQNSVGSVGSTDFSKFIEQYMEVRQLIEPSVASQAEKVIDEIGTTDEPSKKNELLGSLRNIFEGAGGGVIAQGLIRLLEKFSF